MKKKKPPLDMINAVLEDCIMAFPVSSFIIGLYKHYLKWGSMSKKQLQGLYDKASQIEDMPPGKLAALEAIIKKMPTKDRSPLPKPAPLYEKDKDTGLLIEAILTAYPNHKRALFLKSKYENNELLSPTEVTDLKRIKQMLDKK